MVDGPGLAIEVSHKSVEGTRVGWLWRWSSCFAQKLLRLVRGGEDGGGSGLGLGFWMGGWREGSVARVKWEGWI